MIRLEILNIYKILIYIVDDVIRKNFQYEVKEQKLIVGLGKKVFFKYEKKLRYLTYINTNKDLVRSFSFENIWKIKRYSENERFNGLFIYIHALKRSTRISLLNSSGKVISMYSTGSLFKKKIVVVLIVPEIYVCFFLNNLNKNLKSSNVIYCLKGYGPGRRPMLNLLKRNKLKYTKNSVIDLTSLAFNGCRRKRSRRV